jgi:hypothetical protein
MRFSSLPYVLHAPVHPILIQPPTTFSLGPDILLSTLFSNTLRIMKVFKPGM